MRPHFHNHIGSAAKDGPLSQHSSSIVGIVALIFGSLFIAAVLCLASIHTFSGNSDGATVVLEGQAINGGNLTLHGWSLTLESFWSIDAIFYGAAIRLAGLRPELMHVVPAAIATLVVLVGAYLARAGRRGVDAIVSAGSVVALLGLPSPVLAYFMLQGPWHVGTALWCLVAFAGLARGSFDWRWIIATGFLAAGLLGDLMTVMLGVIPVAMAGLISMCRCRNWRLGLSTFAAAPASSALAFAAHSLAALMGSFAIVNRNLPVSSVQIEWNLRHLVSLIASLLGVGTLPIGIARELVVLQAFRLVGALVVAIAILGALVGVISAVIRPQPDASDSPGSWRLDDLLLIGFFGDLVTFVVLSPTSNSNYVRYLTPGVIFGAILAGRMIGRVASSLRQTWMRRLALTAASCVVFAFGFEVASYVEAPAPAQAVEQLTAFLEQHDLTLGIGDYWSSSLVTVKSAGAVAVRPVTNNNAGILHRYDRQSTTSWYAGQSFQFFVYDAARPFRKVNSTTASATFGAPTKTYDVGTYRVLVWSHPLSLSPALPPQPDPIKIFWRL